jgi:hypothetical protein
MKILKSISFLLLALLFVVSCKKKEEAVPKEWYVSTVVGGKYYGYQDGVADKAVLFGPIGLVLGKDGILYIADGPNHCIRKLDIGANMVSTFAGDTAKGYKDGTLREARFKILWGLAQDEQGNFYIGDGENGLVRSIDKQGVVSTFAGDSKATGAGYQDGYKDNALFGGITNIETDKSGNLYIPDLFNHCIRKVDRQGNVSTIAGVANQQGYLDGVANQALFSFPIDVALDSKGNIYVADGGNYAIRKIDLQGNVSTVAQYNTDSKGGKSYIFTDPRVIEVDREDNLIVGDATRLLKIDKQGVITTLAGKERTQGNEDGFPLDARFGDILGLAIAPDGTIYIADQNYSAIKKLYLREKK